MICRRLHSCPAQTHVPPPAAATLESCRHAHTPGPVGTAPGTPSRTPYRHTNRGHPFKNSARPCRRRGRCTMQPAMDTSCTKVGRETSAHCSSDHGRCLPIQIGADRSERSPAARCAGRETWSAASLGGGNRRRELSAVRRVERDGSRAGILPPARMPARSGGGWRAAPARASRGVNTSCGRAAFSSRSCVDVQPQCSPPCGSSRHSFCRPSAKRPFFLTAYPGFPATSSMTRPLGRDRGRRVPATHELCPVVTREASTSDCPSMDRAPHH